MKMRRGMSRLLAWALCFALLLSSVPLGLAETNFLAREHDHSHDGQCVTYYYGEDGQLYRYVEWIEGGQVVSAESQVAYAEMDQLRQERERAEAEARAAAEAAARRAAEQAAAERAAAAALQAAREEAARKAAEEEAQRQAEAEAQAAAAQAAAEAEAQRQAEAAAQAAEEAAKAEAAAKAEEAAKAEAAAKAEEAKKAAEKKTEPVEEKKTEPVEEKKTEPVEEKKTEPVEEKKTEAVEEKKTEPVEEKKTEPVEEKKTEDVEEKKTEDVEEKKTEPVEEPKAEETEETVEEPKAEETEETVEEPKAEETEETVEEPKAEETEETVEEPKAEETEETVEEPKAEETEEAVEAKPATLTAKKAMPLLGAKPLMKTIGEKQESAEEDGAEPATQEQQIGLGAVIRDDAEPCENDERALRETRRELAGNPNCTAVGASGHTVDYDVYKAEYCIHCWHLYKDTEKVAETVPVEEPHVWKDGVCSLCGYVCEHAFEDGKCTVCGMAEPEKPCEHEFVDGVCAKCGVACEHVFENGKCTVCGMACEHVFEDGKCTVCGMACEHVFEDGKCTVCGTVCEHEFEDGKCTVCGTVCEHAFENGVCTVCGVACEHEFVDGVCAKCEYVCAHPAESLSARFVEGSEDENGEKEIELVCGVCGKTLNGDEDANADNGIMLLSLVDHSELNTPTCTSADCKHKWVITSKTWSSESTPQRLTGENAAAYHQVTVTYDVTVECSQCPMTAKTKLTDVVLRAHNWNGDKCSSCNFSNNCTHERKYLKRWMADKKNWWYNPDSHGYTGIACSQLTCLMCGQTFTPVKEDTYRTSVTEGHHFVEGVCTVCGYKKSCSHTHTKQVSVVESYREKGEITQENDNEHKYTDATIFIETVCTDCNKTLEKTLSTAKTLTEAHYFVNGVCTICGYKRPACKHTSTYSYKSISLVRNMHSNGWKTHSFMADETTYTICNLCGECIGQVTETNKWFKKDHIFDGKYCIDCGEKKGKTTTKKTATPAPTATPVPANPFEMVKYMMDVVDQTLKRDWLAEFEIVGASEILTRDEYAKLQGLSAKEQILVVLESVGLGTDVDLSISRLQLSPTQAERNLSNEIYLRMYRLSTEEKAALNALLAEYFPIIQVTESGKTFDYFTMTLNITANGQTTTATYGFRYDTIAREWVFLTLTYPTEGQTAAAAQTTALPLPTPAPAA